MGLIVHDYVFQNTHNRQHGFLLFELLLSMLFASWLIAAAYTQVSSAHRLAANNAWHSLILLQALVLQSELRALSHNHAAIPPLANISQAIEVLTRKTKLDLQNMLPSSQVSVSCNQSFYCNLDCSWMYFAKQQLHLAFAAS